MVKGKDQKLGDNIGVRERESRALSPLSSLDFHPRRLFLPVSWAPRQFPVPPTTKSRHEPQKSGGEALLTPCPPVSVFPAGDCSLRRAAAWTHPPHTPGPLPWAPQPGTQSEHLDGWCSPGWDRLPSCLSHLQPGASRLPAPSGRASTPQNKFQKPRLRAQSQGGAALPGSLPSFAFLFLRCLSFPAGGFVC